MSPWNNAGNVVEACRLQAVNNSALALRTAALRCVMRQDLAPRSALFCHKGILERDPTFGLHHVSNFGCPRRGWTAALKRNQCAAHDPRIMQTDGYTLLEEDNICAMKVKLEKFTIAY
jgi:hypothetical protein